MKLADEVTLPPGVITILPVLAPVGTADGDFVLFLIDGTFVGERNSVPAAYNVRAFFASGKRHPRTFQDSS